MSYSSRDHINDTNSIDYRHNSTSSRDRTGTLSSLVLDRNRRSIYRENDSLSGSRTRSSSRTTSGNPDSSRSRSVSPSYEEEKEKQELDNVPSRRRRFLQRWEDDEVYEGKPVVESTKDNNINNNNNKSDPNELPYVYQQPEFIRISQDIIRKCEAEDVLKDFFKTLDKDESFDLSLISDQQLRKKLRHLSKALYLERKDSEFKKPPECKISLLQVFEELLPFIKAKANAQGPYQRKFVNQEPEDEESNKNIKRKLTREEAEELLSLREMHEQGYFVDYENIQKEFLKKQKQLDLWGKSPAEQKALLASGEDKDSDEQPWRVFDREKEFLNTSQATAKDYNNLLNSAKNFKESFKVVSKSTSFL